MKATTMILHNDNPEECGARPLGEARERHEALLRALRRMGFHDPEGLAGPPPPLPRAAAAPLAQDDDLPRAA
jgi:hypothetical protein